MSGVVNGVPLPLLVERVGSTPFFAYDRAAIDARVASLRLALPGDVRLSYAVKANPMPAVVQHLARAVDALDVASGAEMRIALDTGTEPGEVSFAGPGKSVAELSQAVAAGVLVELESPLEADRLVGAAARLGIRPRVAVRVNPDFEVKGSGMRMGGGAQQFGVDAEAVPSLLKTLAERDIEMAGFHVFSGAQNLHAEILASAQERTVELVLRLAADLPESITYLNIGGGFGIPYYAQDEPLDVAHLGARLEVLLATRVRPEQPSAQVVIELGRYLVGEAGIYVTRVVDRKVSRGETFLVVDGGMHHQLAASGNFGQVIRRNYPLSVVAAREVEGGSGGGSEGGIEETVQVVGCLCTPLDLLGDKVKLPRAEVGDLVVVHQAGAYGLTASPTAFLSHPVPLEVLV